MRLLLSLLLLVLAPADGGAGGAPAVAAASNNPAVTPDPRHEEKEGIRRTVRRHIAEVNACYDRAALGRPGLAGTFTVRFKVEADGAVSDAVLASSTTHDMPLESCLLAAVRRWQFDKPPGGRRDVVSYPFVLPNKAIPLPVAAGVGPVEITILDPHTLVHRSTNAAGIPSNGLIAVTSQGLVLIDTAWSEPQTEAILKWGAAWLGRPSWIGAVITHDHPDRDGGIAALQRRHIPVAALDLTVDKLRRRGVQGVATLFTAQAGEWTDPRDFEAFYPGPGHTSDNIVVRFRGFLFGGCLIKSMDAQDLGFTGDADLAHWPESVRRVEARYPRMTVVPGHGPVDETAGAYQHTLDLLAAARKK